MSSNGDSLSLVVLERIRSETGLAQPEMLYRVGVSRATVLHGLLGEAEQPSLLMMEDG